MEYHIDYQYLPKGHPRPTDDGEFVGIEANDQSGVVVLPNVGDYVSICLADEADKRDNFEGKVRSRLFRYIITHKNKYCEVKIVVEQDDSIKWEELIKE